MTSISNINFFISTMCENLKSPVEIHQLLVAKWGKDYIISLRRVEQIAKKSMMKADSVLRERVNQGGRVAARRVKRWWWSVTS